LDLSFNLLRSIPDTLHHLQKLKTVYFVQDRISTISGLDRLGATLTSLELGGNKIRVIFYLPIYWIFTDRERLTEDRRVGCARQSRGTVAGEE
jgi:hypothetical protein